MLKIPNRFVLLLLLTVTSYSVNAQLFHHSHSNAYREYSYAKDNGWTALVKMYQRGYVGFARPYFPVHLRTDYVGLYANNSSFNNINDNKHYLPDTFIEHDIVTSKSLLGTLGTYFGLSKVGKDGEFVLNVELDGGYLQGTKDNVDVDMIYGAMPVSLEYKSGGEGRLNKTKKLLFSIGAGASYYSFDGSVEGSYANGGGTVQGITPFAKIELGYFLGIAFKLGARVNFLPVRFNTSYSRGGYSENTFTELTLENTTIKPGVTLSIALLPFSWDWSDDKWDY